MLGSPTQRPEACKRTKFDIAPTEAATGSTVPAGRPAKLFAFKPKQVPVLLPPPPSVPYLPTATPSFAFVDDYDGLASSIIDAYDGREDPKTGMPEAALAPEPSLASVSSPAFEARAQESYQDLVRFSVAMMRVTQRAAPDRAVQYASLYDPFSRVGLPVLADKPEFEANISAALDWDLFVRIQGAVRNMETSSELADRLLGMSSRGLRARAFVLSNHARRLLAVRFRRAARILWRYLLV